MRAARIRKSARIAGGTLLAAALLPWVGLSAAQAVTSPYDGRALYFEGNVNKCPAGAVELLAKDGGGQYVTIAAVDGHTVTHIYVKGGPGYHLYEPGERGLQAAPWEDLRSPDNPGDNVPEISHVLVCGIPTPVETSTTAPPSETTTPPSETTTPPVETTTTPPVETTTTPPVETTTTPPVETTTTPPPTETSTSTPTDDTEVLGTKTTAPPSATSTVGAKVTATPQTQVLGTKTSALPRTGGDIARTVAASAAMMVMGLGLLFAGSPRRRRPRKH